MRTKSDWSFRARTGPAIPESVITACGYGFRPSPPLRLGRNEEPCASCPRRSSISAAAVAKPSRSPAMPAPPTRYGHLAPDHARVAELAAVQTDAAYAYRRM